MSFPPCPPWLFYSHSPPSASVSVLIDRWFVAAWSPALEGCSHRQNHCPCYGHHSYIRMIDATRPGAFLQKLSCRVQQTCSARSDIHASNLNPPPAKLKGYAPLFRSVPSLHWVKSITLLRILCQCKITCSTTSDRPGLCDWYFCYSHSSRQVGHFCSARFYPYESMISIKHFISLNATSVALS